MVHSHPPRVSVSDSALLIIIHADAHSSSSRTRALILACPFCTVHCPSSMRTRTHLHRGRAHSSSRARSVRCTAHHPCGRAHIFIADARTHHLSAATRPGRRTVHHPCGRALIFIADARPHHVLLLPVLDGAQFIIRADAHSSSSRTRALTIYLLLLVSDSTHLSPLSSICRCSFKTGRSSILDPLSAAVDPSR
ncbi:hypothetical protein R3P38DRAFT_3230470 [Favolaschia claudopus]|uniref:C2H2-type domain-containing protein n=1 Tax=Favolaschia claudopus TaxID=2862362 RepID=A0AAV9ZNR2_9AGAR